MAEQINFSKRESSSYISINQSTTIIYSVTNLNNAPITSLIIQDPIISMTDISTSVFSGGTLNVANSAFTMLLPIGGLVKNQTVSSALLITTNSKTSPSDTKYSTTATCTALVSTIPATTIVDNDVGKLQINYALIDLSISVAPITPVAPGDPITFTIRLNNNGNHQATIGTGAFQNYWSPLRLGNIVISDNRFFSTSSQITNISSFNLKANESLSFTINATII